MTIVPVMAVALILLLPDYGEIGFGGFGMKRLEERIAGQVEQVSRNVEDIRSSFAEATGINKDVEAGTIHKGRIRNVELRVRTVQEMILRSLLADADDLSTALYSAGVDWGASWSEDFADIEGGLSLGDVDGVRSAMKDWEYYDATAGLGKFSFDLNDDGVPYSLEVRNCFLSIERDSADLRMLFAGYVAGSLDGLFKQSGLSFEVVLVSKSVDRDRYDIASRAER